VLADCIKRIKLTKLNKERKNIEVKMQEMEKGKENERMNELLAGMGAVTKTGGQPCASPGKEGIRTW
jgi:hypothetical protein